jgi:transposase InsO family protein
MEAVNLVRLKGWGVREAARHIGVSAGTVSKWMAKAPEDGRMGIPTLSSRPHTHPTRIADEIRDMIVAERKKTKRCGAVIQKALEKQGVAVGRNTIYRVLDDHYLTKKYSLWKKRHMSTERPFVGIPGDLIEMDTVHCMISPKKRVYVYTLIDVCSRWAHAMPSLRITAGRSVSFLHGAREAAPFNFGTIQSDHGPEFSSWFTIHAGMPHRHSRVRKPNDQAHVERFNRTLREECLYRLPVKLSVYEKEIPAYINYYNNERMHMGIEYMTPVEKLARVFPRSWE